GSASIREGMISVPRICSWVLERDRSPPDVLSCESSWANRSSASRSPLTRSSMGGSGPSVTMSTSLLIAVPRSFQLFQPIEDIEGGVVQIVVGQRLRQVQQFLGGRAGGTGARISFQDLRV